MNSAEARRIVALAARATLDQGGVVAFATESSYALGVDPRDEIGVATVARIKGRDADKPLPVVAANVEQLNELPLEPGSPALEWARGVWPAAISVLLPLRSALAASRSESSVAVRVPASESLRELLASVATPLTATSANRSGEAPLVDPREVARWLDETGELYCLVDEGVAPGGAPSTLVAIDGNRIKVLRKGRVHVE